MQGKIMNTTKTKLQNAKYKNKTNSFKSGSLCHQIQISALKIELKQVDFVEVLLCKNLHV